LAASYKNPSNPSTSSADGLYEQKPQYFAPNWALKMRGSQQLFFGGWLMSRIFQEFQHPAIQTKIVQHFGEFFHQIIVRQTKGRKDSIQNVCRKSMRLEA
jgi:hypothetical protein